MTTYLATNELRTSWWTKFLRWLHIKPKRNEFKLTLNDAFFKKGDILDGVCRYKLLILRKIG